MNTTCCSHARGTAPNGGPARSWLKAAGSALPGVITVLLPKCPLCFAAWIAAGTGIVLPTMIANNIRPLLLIACVLSISLMILHAKRDSDWPGLGRHRS